MSRARVPTIFIKIACRWLLISPELAGHWWAALSKTTWSEARSLRQTLLLWESGSMTLDGFHFVHKVLSPEALVFNLDNLCRERLLSREMATRLQEAVMVHVGPDGRWI
jgi:hypothetical protein